MIIRVDTSTLILRVGEIETPCAIGRSGTVGAAAKREGDGATPLGHWPVHAALLRPDRVRRVDTKLPWRWVRPDDGWSDDSRDPAYNRPVRHPHAFSAERLWRDDGLYDVIVILGHNDSPPVVGMGSAIFLHCWNQAKPTEGCVAVDHEALLKLVERMTPGDLIEIA